MENPYGTRNTWLSIICQALIWGGQKNLQIVFSFEIPWKLYCLTLKNMRLRQYIN